MVWRCYEIKWHQDIQFWPHTDFSPLTIGVYLADVDDVMGPMGVFPVATRVRCMTSTLILPSGVADEP